jgi:hypothetical protein
VRGLGRWSVGTYDLDRFVLLAHRHVRFPPLQR